MRPLLRTLHPWPLYSLCVLALSGCIKLQVLPEDSLQHGVDAGQKLIDQAKLARAGGKKMTLATEVKLTPAVNQGAAEQACLAELKTRATQASSKRAYELVSEKTHLAKRDGLEVIGCEILIYVWNN